MSSEPTAQTHPERWPASTEDGHAWQSLAWPAQKAIAAVYWLPALGVPAEKYSRWATALQARGIDVVVHEWRGFGSSSRRPSRRCDWGYRELLEQDIARGLATAQGLRPDRRWVLGGHSLGGQLASLALAKQPQCADALLLIATGVPAARHFPRPRRWLVSGFAHALPILTRMFGLFPGDRLRWAGREAGQVMRDWARSVRSGGYSSLNLHADMDAGLRALRQPILALRFDTDWLVPDGSLEDLLARIGNGGHRLECFDAARMGARADHFRWMRHPEAVVDCIVAWISTAPSAGDPG
jgi:predicted alpha/beta hydrolase